MNITRRTAIIIELLGGVLGGVLIGVPFAFVSVRIFLRPDRFYGNTILPLTYLIPAMIVGDLEQPGRELRFWLVFRLPAINLEEHLLRNLLGPRPIAQKMERKVHHRRGVFLKELLKRSNFSLLKTQH